LTTALALFGKEEKERVGGGGSGGGSSVARMRDVAGKLRLSTGDALDFVIPDMGADWYEFPGFAIYPLRSLFPPINLARYIGKLRGWPG